MKLTDKKFAGRLHRMFHDRPLSASEKDRLRKSVDPTNISADTFDAIVKLADDGNGPAGTAANPMDGQRDSLSSPEIEGTGQVAPAPTDQVMLDEAPEDDRPLEDMVMQMSDLAKDISERLQAGEALIDGVGMEEAPPPDTGATPSPAPQLVASKKVAAPGTPLRPSVDTSAPSDFSPAPTKTQTSKERYEEGLEKADSWEVVELPTGNEESLKKWYKIESIPIVKEFGSLIKKDVIKVYEGSGSVGESTFIVHTMKDASGAGFVTSLVDALAGGEAVEELPAADLDSAMKVHADVLQRAVHRLPTDIGSTPPPPRNEATPIVRKSKLVKTDIERVPSPQPGKPDAVKKHYKKSDVFLVTTELEGGKYLTTVAHIPERMLALQVTQADNEPAALENHKQAVDACISGTIVVERSKGINAPSWSPPEDQVSAPNSLSEIEKVKYRNLYEPADARTKAIEDNLVKWQEKLEESSKQKSLLPGFEDVRKKRLEKARAEIQSSHDQLVKLLTGKGLTPDEAEEYIESITATSSAEKAKRLQESEDRRREERETRQKTEDQAREQTRQEFKNTRIKQLEDSEEGMLDEEKMSPEEKARAIDREMELYDDDLAKSLSKALGTSQSKGKGPARELSPEEEAKNKKEEERAKLVKKLKYEEYVKLATSFYTDEELDAMSEEQLAKLMENIDRNYKLNQAGGRKLTLDPRNMPSKFKMFGPDIGMKKWEGEYLKATEPKRLREKIVEDNPGMDIPGLMLGGTTGLEGLESKYKTMARPKDALNKLKILQKEIKHTPVITDDHEQFGDVVAKPLSRAIELMESGDPTATVRAQELVQQLISDLRAYDINQDVSGAIVKRFGPDWFSDLLSDVEPPKGLDLRDEQKKKEDLRKKVAPLPHAMRKELMEAYAPNAARTEAQKSKEQKFYEQYRLGRGIMQEEQLAQLSPEDRKYAEKAINLKNQFFEKRIKPLRGLPAQSVASLGTPAELASKIKSLAAKLLEADMPEYLPAAKLRAENAHEIENNVAKTMVTVGDIARNRPNDVPTYLELLPAKQKFMIMNKGIKDLPPEDLARMPPEVLDLLEKPFGLDYINTDVMKKVPDDLKPKLASRGWQALSMEEMEDALYIFKAYELVYDQFMAAIMRAKNQGSPGVGRPVKQPKSIGQPSPNTGLSVRPKRSMLQPAKNYYLASLEQGDTMTEDRMAKVADVIDQVADLRQEKVSQDKFQLIADFMMLDADMAAASDTYARIMVASMNHEVRNMVDRAVVDFVLETVNHEVPIVLSSYNKPGIYVMAVLRSEKLGNLVKREAEAKMKTPKPSGQPDDAVKVEDTEDMAEEGEHMLARPAHLHMEVSDMCVEGALTKVTVQWDPDDEAADMSPSGLVQALISFMKGKESTKEFKDLGFLGKIEVEEVDPDAGMAVVYFRSMKPADAVQVVRTE